MRPCSLIASRHDPRDVKRFKNAAFHCLRPRLPQSCPPSHRPRRTLRPPAVLASRQLPSGPTRPVPTGCFSKRPTSIRQPPQPHPTAVGLANARPARPTPRPLPTTHHPRPTGTTSAAPMPRSHPTCLTVTQLCATRTLPAYCNPCRPPTQPSRTVVPPARVAPPSPSPAPAPPA